MSDNNDDILTAVGINAKPTDDEVYNRIHTLIETSANHLSMEGVDALYIVGAVRLHRDYINRNLAQVGEDDIPVEQFVGWCNAERDRLETQATGWEENFFAGLNEILVNVTEDVSGDVGETVAAYRRYVDTATDEFEEIHDADGFFEETEK